MPHPSVPDVISRYIFLNRFFHPVSISNQFCLSNNNWCTAAALWGVAVAVAPPPHAPRAPTTHSPKLPA
jgi:hypothetical protein